MIKPQQDNGVTFVFRGVLRDFFYTYGFYITVEGLKMRFYAYGFLPMVLEAVLEAARKKTHAVPYLNCSPLYLNRSPLNIAFFFL